MLEKPDIPDSALRLCLREQYGFSADQIEFLPLGADVNSAVYRVVADDGSAYFLKLRGGTFDEITVEVPRLLSTEGIDQVVAPLETVTGRPYAPLNAYAATVFPFVDGRSGFDAAMSASQWRQLGTALKSIHSVDVPPLLRQRIPRETYSTYWRDRVRVLLARAERTEFSEPTALRLSGFLRSRHDDISHFVGRADAFGVALRSRSLVQVLCHADIHAGNVLIGADDALYIVDWDTVTFAPKERDLMFIGGGVGGVWERALDEELFYRGYGPAPIDMMAVAYYRYERIVQDIAAFCEQILLTDGGGKDREASLVFFLDQFQPNNVVAIALETDRRLRAETDRA